VTRPLLFARRLLPLLLVAYPFVTHALVVAGYETLSVVLIILICLLGLTGARSPDGKVPTGMRLLWLVAIIASLVNLATGTADVMLLLPVVLNLALAAFCLVSLRAGNTPFLERMIRLAHPAGARLRPDVITSARTLTWTWVGFFLVMTAVDLRLAYYVPTETWSLFTNVIYFALIAALVLTQYLYHRIRFGGLASGSLWRFVRAVTDPHRLSELRPLPGQEER